MNTITEANPTELSAVSTGLTWTGLHPDYKLSDSNAGLLLSYCSGLASAATWVVVDVGRWKRAELRRRYTVGSDQYNEAVGNLYRELSEYMPSVQSDVSWRSYLNVAERVPYKSRVEGFGPAVYLPALTLSPDAWDSFVLSVQEGTHKTFLAGLYGQRATQLAPTASTNGYSAHDESDDVPYSASGPGVYAEAPEWVEEYEGQSVNDNLPVLSWETLGEIQALVVAALLGHCAEATELAGKIEPKIDAFYVKAYFS